MSADRWSQWERQHGVQTEQHIRLGNSGLRLTKRGEMLLVALTLLLLISVLALVGMLEGSA